MKMNTLGHVFIASLSLFCNGLLVGWNSHSNNLLRQMNDNEKVWITASLALGAAIGSIIALKVWKYTGTKLCILISYFLILLSTIMTMQWTSFFFILGARTACGIAAGTIHFLIPVYIQEIAEFHQRKKYECILDSLFALGILVMYATGYANNLLVSNILLAIASIASMICVVLISESPVYLCTKGKLIDAQDIIAKFNNLSEETRQRILNWNIEHKIKNTQISTVYNGDLSVKAVLAVIGLVVLKQLIGAISLTFYMEDVLARTYVEYSPLTSAMLCCLAFIAGIIFPHFFGSKCKNKSIFYWSLYSQAICMVLLGFYVHYQGTLIAKIDDYKMLPLLLLGLYFFSFAIGPHRLTWYFIEKIIPLENQFVIRSILIAINWFVIFGITKVLPTMIRSIGVGWLYWYMSIMCMFYIMFLKTILFKLIKLPEEKKLVYSSSESNSENNSYSGYV